MPCMTMDSTALPKVAQDLARHSTIQLTLDRYTHTALETHAHLA